MVFLDWGLKFILEVWRLLLEMSPYLLLGFFVAGILRLFIPSRILDKHLSGNGLSSIIKASLLGVPLPLCSCGVMPVAAHLKKEGASKSAVISFLTSTPTTGVDSILATYSLMGPLFAIFRPLVALFMGVFSGVMQLVFGKEVEDGKKISSNSNCVICDSSSEHIHSFTEKIRFIFEYAFIELVADVSKWLVIGILLGAMITTFVPHGIMGSYFSGQIMTYLVMLVVGVPLYVCATGSIPIASSLMSIGVSPGAALVFLIVGPATNAATISFVGGKLGRRSLVIYIASIVFMAIFSGIIFDYVWKIFGSDTSMITGGMDMLPSSIKVVSAIILISTMVVAYLKNNIFHQNHHIDNGITLTVLGMSCGNCRRKVENAIHGIDEDAKIEVNLDKHSVKVESTISLDDIKEAIELAGYEVK